MQTSSEKDFRTRLLIFDFDGLIIDTETPDYESWQEIYQEHGQTLSLAAWADCIGAHPDFFVPDAHLEDLLGYSIDREAVRAKRRARFHELVEQEPLRPGIMEYLDAAKRMGILLSVASSAGRNWVAGHLERRGLLDRFDCIKTVEDVASAKPAPDLFLAVLDELGVEAQAAIVLEDSVNGITAARRAGIFCLAIPNPMTARLDLSEADLCVPSLAEFPLEQLVARFPGVSVESPVHSR